MTDTVISSATREVVIGFDRPFVHHRRAHQSDRPQDPRRRDGGRRLQPRRGRRTRAGGGRRAHARRQCRHSAGRRAGDPRPGDPAGAVDHRRAAVDRFVDRRRARGGARGLQGQGAGQLGDRRGGAAREPCCRWSRSTAPRWSRSPTTRPASREDPDVRFAVAKKIVERAADYGIPRLRHRRRSAGDADRRDQRRPACR